MRRSVSREPSKARLSYVSRHAPGIRRVRRGRGFLYLDRDGSRLDQPRDLGRIRSLAIPPAWRDVWISPTPDGHLQAVGTDARGRLQYRYHPAWTASRDVEKFGRLAEFGKRLPQLRSAAADVVRRAEPTREATIAGIIMLLDATAARVGSERYCSENHTFGLTTLRRRHVHVDGERVRLAYRGKGGRRIDLTVRNRSLGRLLERCSRLPGQHVFQAADEEGEVHRVSALDVNRYIQETMGGPFSAKDFRTWTATVLAADLLSQCEAPQSKAGRRRVINEAVARVAERLGNTPAVCRKSYIAPGIFAAFEDGMLHRIRRGYCRKALSEPESFALRVLEKAAESPR